MPLHDLSYQRFDGERTPPPRRSYAIARAAVAQLLKKRAFLLLLGICWIPAIVRAVMIYISRQFPQSGAFLTVDQTLWQEFLAQQVLLLPVLLVALYVGASAIAGDLASGAFVIYLSKPLTRFDYLAGRALPVAAAILFVTLVPAWALLTVHLSIAEDFTLLADSPLLPLSVAAYSAWLSLLFTLLVLAISSLTRSGRVAGAGFIALALGTKTVFFGALTQLRLREPPVFLSLIDASIDAGHVFFLHPSAGDAPYLSLAAMTLVMAASLAVLRVRLRSAEASS